MNKVIQVKRRNPNKEKEAFIVVPMSNGNLARSVKEGNNVKLPSLQAPWYPIFRAKKHDPL